MNLETRVQEMEGRLAQWEAERKGLLRSRRAWKLSASVLGIGLAVVLSLGMTDLVGTPATFSGLRLVDAQGTLWGQLETHPQQGAILRLQGPEGSVQLSAQGLQFQDAQGASRASLDLSKPGRPAILRLGSLEAPSSTLMPGSLRLQSGSGREQTFLEAAPGRTRLLFSDANALERGSFEALEGKHVELRMALGKVPHAIALKADAEDPGCSLVLGRRGEAQAGLAVDSSAAVLNLGIPATKAAVMLGAEGPQARLTLESKGMDHSLVESMLYTDSDTASLLLRGFGSAKGMDMELPTGTDVKVGTSASDLARSAKATAKKGLDKGRKLVKKLF